MSIDLQLEGKGCIPVGEGKVTVYTEIRIFQGHWGNESLGMEKLHTSTGIDLDISSYIGGSVRLLATVSGGRDRLKSRRGAANVANRHGAGSELQAEAGMGNVNPGKRFMLHPNCIKYSAKPLFYTCKRCLATSKQTISVETQRR